MSADIDALAAAVAAQLNDPARPWAGQFVATVGKTPHYTPQELSTLKVHVLPFGITYDTQQRGVDAARMILEVAFNRHAENKPASGEDIPLTTLGSSLVALERSVIDFLRARANRRPPNYSVAQLETTELRPLYDAEILRNQRRFVGVIRLTYLELVETP